MTASIGAAARPNGRKTVEKTQVIRNHRGHLRLLQHDLGKPDAVRVTRVLPGQVMAAGALLPGDQLFGKGLAGAKFCLDAGCGSTDNTASFQPA
jgi:hypothetical protein